VLQKGGNINITTGSLFSTHGTRLSTGSAGYGGPRISGNVTIAARDTVSFDGGDYGFSGVNSSLYPAGAVGNAGNINITTGSLFLTNGATLTSGTRGHGNAGNITVTARDTVSFDGIKIRPGASPDVSGIFSSVYSEGVGNGGNVNITSNSLSVTNGAQVSAEVEGGTQLPLALGGRGSGGSIRVDSNAVDLVGVGSNGSSSGLFTNTGRGASGQAGNINVNTGAFRLADGAIVTAQTFNLSNAGNVTINANTFEAINGGQVLTNTYSSGNAGSIRLNAADTSTLSGSDHNLAERLARVAQQKFYEEVDLNQIRNFVVNQDSASGLFANTAPGATGNGGNIFIDPSKLNIIKGAIVSVSSFGKGDAGNITASANSILLDQGKLTAESAVGKGGNIQIGAEDLLLLRHSSNISAVSGAASSNGLDGNINIGTKFLIAVPSENSDVVATGFGHSVGSNVQLHALRIFGTQYRQQLTPESDIVATGTVKLETPQFAPSLGLVALPVVPVDLTRLIAQECQANVVPRGSKFIVTGRGGLPDNPSYLLSADAVEVNLVTLNAESKNRSVTSVSTQPSSATPAPLVEATGWVIGANGQVTLTAQAPTATLQIPWLTPAVCHLQ